MPNDAADNGFQSVLAPFHGSICSGKARLWLRLPRTDSKPAPARRFLGAGRIGDAGIASVRRPELVGQETARKCEHAAATDDPHSSLLEIFIASRLSGLCSRLHIGCP